MQTQRGAPELRTAAHERVRGRFRECRENGIGQPGEPARLGVNLVRHVLAPVVGSVVVRLLIRIGALERGPRLPGPTFYESHGSKRAGAPSHVAPALSVPPDSHVQWLSLRLRFRYRGYVYGIGGAA